MIDKKSFICGFVTGEGCFTFQIQKKNINAIFSITTNIQDISLLKIIKDELGVGRISVLKKDFSCAFQVTKFEDIKKLTYYFDDNLNGVKLKDFLIWKEGVLKLQEIRIQGVKTKYKEKEYEYFKSLRPRDRKDRKQQII